MSDAADRLARTRLAIIEQIHRRDSRPMRRDAASDSPGLFGEEEWESKGGPASWFASAKRALGGWWRQHPARMGVELATPLLSEYAGRKPVQFLAIAAALGAVVAITRPWRLVSATGLVMALLKSSQLSGVLMSAMSAADFSGDQRRRR